MKNWERLNQLSNRLILDGKFEEAERVCREELEEGAKFGPDSPRYAASLNQLGMLHQQMGRYVEAENCYLRSMGIWERALGSACPQMAGPLNNLAWIYSARRQYARAEQLRRRALGIRLKALGPDHPDVARLLQNLGETCRAERKYAEAEDLFRQSLAVWRKNQGMGRSEVGSIYNNLALLRMTAGRTADAVPLFRNALEVWETATPDHPVVALGLMNLAVAQHGVRQDREADALLVRADGIAEKKLGTAHPLVGDILRARAAVLRKLGKAGEARRLEKRAKEILSRHSRENRLDGTTDVSGLR